jgi:hypothetical protein
MNTKTWLGIACLASIAIGTSIAIQTTQVPATVAEKLIVKTGGEISGKQYIVLGKGATAVADNFIAFFSCSSYVQCEEELKLAKAAATNASYKIFKQEKRDVLSGHFQTIAARHGKTINSTRTDFEGRFKINCPSQYCFVYSIGHAGVVSGFWADIIESNTQTELANSNMISSVDD